MNCVLRLVGMVLFLSAVTLTTCFAQTADEQLLNRRIDLHIENGTIVEALGKIGSQEIPLGVEFSPEDKQKCYLNLDLKQAPLHLVLDLVLQGETKYRWFAREGVINIEPVEKRDPLLEKFLLTQVDKFDPPKGLRNYFLRDEVMALPEVVKLLEVNGLKASHSGNGVISEPYDLRVDLKAYRVEVRSILNQIIRETHMKIWSITRSGPKSEYFHLYF